MPTQQLRKTTKAGIAYQRLKEKINSGALAADRPITEALVSDLLNVGRGPAREALLKLEAEGLICSRGPHKSRYIQFAEDLDLEEFQSQCEMREVIDGLAARGAATHLTGGQIRRLRELHTAIAAAVHTGDRLGRGEATRELFEIIRTGCGNPLVLKALDACGILPIFAREDETDASLWTDRQAIDRRVTSLAAVVETIASHDPDDAEAAMRASVRENTRFVLDWLRSKRI